MSDRYIVTGPDYFTQIIDTVTGRSWGDGNQRDVAQRRVDDWNRVERARDAGCREDCRATACERCWKNEIADRTA